MSYILSRRSIEKKEDEIPEGCLFYVPLSEGRFNDEISGKQGILTGYGSMLWNSNVNMYGFTSPGANQYIMSYDVALNASQFPTNSQTVLARLMKMGTRANNAGTATLLPFSLSETNGYSSIININPTGYANPQTWDEGINETAAVWTGTHRKIYANGRLIIYLSAPQVVTPHNAYVNKTAIVFGNTFHGSGWQTAQYYMKEYYIINREMSEQEIFNFYKWKL